MKRILLALLTLFCMMQVQAQLVHSARDIFINAFNKAKELVVAHPYATASLGTAAVLTYWLYSKMQDEDEDPSYANFKEYFQRKSPTGSPSDSPTHSSDALKDFTGDFPDTQSRALHPSKLRHN